MRIKTLKKTIITCILLICSAADLAPSPASSQKRLIQYIAGACLVTAGGIGVAKTKRSLTNRRRLKTKVLRAASILSIIAGSATALHAGYTQATHSQQSTQENATPQNQSLTNYATTTGLPHTDLLSDNGTAGAASHRSRSSSVDDADQAETELSPDTSPPSDEHTSADTELSRSTGVAAGSTDDGPLYAGAGSNVKTPTSKVPAPFTLCDLTQCPWMSADSTSYFTMSYEQLLAKAAYAKYDLTKDLYNYTFINSSTNESLIFNSKDAQRGITIQKVTPTAIYFRKFNLPLHRNDSDFYKVTYQREPIDTHEPVYTEVMLYTDATYKKSVWRKIILWKPGTHVFECKETHKHATWHQQINLPRRTIQWSSKQPFTPIAPHTLVDKIIASLNQSTPSLPLAPLTIASLYIRITPNIPAVSLTQSLTLNRLSTNVDKMLQSFKDLYAFAETDQRALARFLDTTLTSDEQLSLLCQAPTVLTLLNNSSISLVPKAMFEMIKNGLHNFCIRWLKIPSSALPLSSPIMHASRAPIINTTIQSRQALTSLKHFWESIPKTSRDELLRCYNQLFLDSATQKAAADYIPLSEYIYLANISTENLVKLTDKLARINRGLPKAQQAILKPYRTIAAQILLHEQPKLLFYYDKMSYNLILEIFNSHAPSSPCLGEQLLAADDAAAVDIITAYATVTSPAPKDWRTLINCLIKSCIIEPIIFSTKIFELHRTAPFVTRVVKAVLPVIEAIINSSTIDDLMHSIQQIKTTLLEAIEAARRSGIPLPPQLADSTNPTYQQSVALFVTEQLYEILAPKQDRETHPLTGLKNKLIIAIQKNQVSWYIDLIIKALSRHRLATSTPQATGTDFILARLKEITRSSLFNPVHTLVKKKINKAIEDQKIPPLDAQKIIDLYNAGVPIINHYLAIIETITNTLSTTEKQRFAHTVQDALWYLG